MLTTAMPSDYQAIRAGCPLDATNAGNKSRREQRAALLCEDTGCETGTVSMTVISGLTDKWLVNEAGGRVVQQ